VKVSKMRLRAPKKAVNIPSFTVSTSGLVSNDRGTRQVVKKLARSSSNGQGKNRLAPDMAIWTMDLKFTLGAGPRDWLS
jgi:hypothetical protein